MGAVQKETLGEEIANSVIHGLGIVLSIAGLGVLTAFASLNGNAWHIVSCSIFSTTLILLYTASTLYHAITHPVAKRVLRTLDHAAIYLLIAGTYTPLALGPLRQHGRGTGAARRQSRQGDLARSEYPARLHQRRGRDAGAL